MTPLSGINGTANKAVAGRELSTQEAVNVNNDGTSGPPRALLTSR